MAFLVTVGWIVLANLDGEGHTGNVENQTSARLHHVRVSKIRSLASLYSSRNALNCSSE